MFNVVEETPAIRAVYALKVVAIATVLVLLAIAGYVYFNRVPLTAKGEITAVGIYQPLPPLSTDASPVSAVPRGNGLLLLAPIKIRNLSEKPLAVMDLAGVIRIGDTDYKSYAASSLDFDKVFQYYPDLATYRQPELPRHAVIPPGAESEGLAVFNYALTEDQWKEASSFYVDVTFDTTPYILHLTWPTFPAHGHIAAVLPPATLSAAAPAQPPSANR
jgi:hypothetical protein